MSTLPIERLVDELLTADRATKNLSVQRKIKKALANIKRARTLLHQAEQTKNWATKLCQLL